jgi:hypothetical protein
MVRTKKEAASSGLPWIERVPELKNRIGAFYGFKFCKKPPIGMQVSIFCVLKPDYKRQVFKGRADE